MSKLARVWKFDRVLRKPVEMALNGARESCWLADVDCSMRGGSGRSSVFLKICTAAGQSRGVSKKAL